jgi:hypothetical protein
VTLKRKAGLRVGDDRCGSTRASPLSRKLNTTWRTTARTSGNENIAAGGARRVTRSNRYIAARGIHPDAVASNQRNIAAVSGRTTACTTVATCDKEVAAGTLAGSSTTVTGRKGNPSAIVVGVRVGIDRLDVEVAGIGGSDRCACGDIDITTSRRTGEGITTVNIDVATSARRSTTGSTVDEDTTAASGTATSASQYRSEATVEGSAAATT